MRILRPPCFPVSACSFSFIFFVLSVSVQRTLEYFYIFIISPVYTDTHSQYTHTCLSYKLAHMLAYTLLSGTLVHLFITLCTLVNTTRIPSVHFVHCSCSLCMHTLRCSCLFVFFGFGLYFLCFPCVCRTLEYFYYIFIRAIQTYTPSVHTCIL
ncbi:hypothetical protein NERG_02584 [Nematocida ausubeli]|uniref:Uncharacterized protein n=1 Tax=Nematocida ausubeli (strain ATCC PRA-371 / ERTm2) TaxID=1913371 RepID=H8ZG63_NEMA1|nr:hypothetical protein NERG_02584 [Nematocida ausubeli]